MTNEARRCSTATPRNKAADADAALQELGSDSSMAYVATVTVWDEDVSPWRRKCSASSRRLSSGRGFTRDRRGHERARGLARLAAGPCLRQCPPALISTLNLAHMIPLSAVWAGRKWDAHSARYSMPARKARPRPALQYPCRRCRPYADRRRPEGQIGPACADGAAVPAV